jgi:hypothetical protein
MYSRKPSQFNLFKFRPWLAVVCASLSIGSAISSTANIPALSQSNNLARISGSREFEGIPPASVIRSIRQTVKQKFRATKITVISATEENWSDDCLGLPEPLEPCNDEIVLGWRVEVRDNLRTWIYRSDRTGKKLRLESLKKLRIKNPKGNILSPVIASKLIQRVAQETNILPAKLRITALKAQKFDSCLGIFDPTRPCSPTTFKGWQAIITSPDQTFVYHLNQNATQIVQNITASGASQKIIVSFDTLGEIPPTAIKEVFRSSTFGNLTGGITSIVLTDDGKITRWQSSPTAKFAPVVIRTLTPPEVNDFKQTLVDLRFSNFNGLSYLSSATLADYPITTYQGDFEDTTQFIDLEKQSLPRSLQALIASWEALSRTK